MKKVKLSKAIKIFLGQYVNIRKEMQSRLRKRGRQVNKLSPQIKTAIETFQEFLSDQFECKPDELFICQNPESKQSAPPSGKEEGGTESPSSFNKFGPISMDEVSPRIEVTEEGTVTVENSEFVNTITTEDYIEQEKTKSGNKGFIEYGDHREIDESEDMYPEEEGIYKEAKPGKEYVIDARSKKKKRS